MPSDLSGAAMIPPPEPRTAAGRALLRDLWGAYAPRVETNDISVKDRILAIEAEAAGAPLRDALERLLRLLEPEYREDGLIGMAIGDVRIELAALAATPAPAPLDELGAAIEQGFRAGRMYQHRHPDSDPLTARAAATEDE